MGKSVSGFFSSIFFRKCGYDLSFILLSDAVSPFPLNLQSLSWRHSISQVGVPGGGGGGGRGEGGGGGGGGGGNGGGG